MDETWIQRAAKKLPETRKNDKQIQAVVFVMVVSPVLLTAVFSYIRTHRQLTEFTLSRGESIAYLTAAKEVGSDGYVAKCDLLKTSCRRFAR